MLGPFSALGSASGTESGVKVAAGVPISSGAAYTAWL